MENSVNPGQTEDLHDRIRVAREYAGLSVAELARRVGVSTPSAHNWETKTFPDAENLSKIAIITDVLFEWLATGRGPMHYTDRDVAREKIGAYAPLSPDQQELLDIFLSLRPTRRAALIEFLKKWK